MATQFFFDGKTVSIPGPYSTIKSGIKNPSVATGFGNTLVINSGSSKFYGGGSGINGTLKQGKDSLYTFDNSRDFKKFSMGGLWWFLSAPLFSPGGGASAGISSLTYVRAATTIPASLTLSFGDSAASDIASDNGDVVIQVNDEGFVGNGVLGDETRAKATITVTGAGVTGNQIAITINGIAAGTYVNLASDSIATVVAGLAAAIIANGYAAVYSQSSTQIVIYAPHGSATSLNGFSPSISATGSASAIASSFSGGAEGTLLTRGYAAKMVAGVNNPAKYIVKFYRGSFKGLDTKISNGDPYDGIPELSCPAELIAQSPEIGTVQALVTYMQTDFNFKSYFTLENYAIGSTDIITSDDLAAYSTYAKFTGGSETFSASDLTAVIDAISDLNFDFILADQWGDNATATSNQTILSWVTNEAPIKPDLYIAGGKDINKWNSGSTSSNQLAIAFNSQYVTLVHGGAKKTAIGGLGFKSYDSIYKAADMLGREAGLAPQVPLTFKNLGIEGELHPLNQKDVKLGLQSGVLMSWAQGGGFEVPKGVNTLQNNTYLVNPDGSTASKQFARIERQLNKELVQNAKTQLFKRPDGTNRNTLSVEDVVTFVQNFLIGKVAKPGEDNLLISWSNVTVTRNQDAYDVVYGFEPNTEISFALFSGIALDPSQP